MAFDEFLASRFRDLRPGNWDKFVRSLDARFLVLEEQLGIQRQVTETVLQRGLQVIEDELGPVITEAQDTASSIDQLLRNLGLLLRASSATSLTIGQGEKIFVIAEELRARFAAPLYVIAAVEGEADLWMAGQVTDWDAATGALSVAVTNTRGEGTFAAWDISIASVPPEIPPAQMAANVALSQVQGMTAAELQSAVEELHAGKAPTASPAFTGEPTAPTAASETNTTQIATTAFVKTAINALIASAPGALDTLNELAAALGNDADFAATMTTALAGKQAANANLDEWSGLAPSSKQAASANLTDWSAIAPAAKQDAMTKATTTEAQAGTDDAHYMTPAKTASAIKAQTIGSNMRSWQNVWASRSFNTTYYNTNAYPIMVAIGETGAYGGSIQLYVNGTHFGYSTAMNAIIPPGGSYSVNYNFSKDNLSWFELK